MEASNWAKFSELDRENFERLTDAPMVKETDAKWQQEESKVEGGRMTR